MRFVERRTENGQEIVVLRYAAIFYWLMWPTLALTILAWVAPSSVVSTVTAVAWVVCLATAAPYWPIVFELKRRMRESSITAAGSKYSFSNPLTYRWAAEGTKE
ncbi:hypothetical protein [Anatilimnocola floriformis]|uniref:hypothetical protein n=1 Tax=Anatilimnocola floriformis TaxID=2948575 RepID=UPI0020C3D775|nr:hypothetical protein [Anatilimnocola floriformis]